MVGIENLQQSLCMHRKVGSLEKKKRKKGMNILHRDPVSITFFELHTARCVEINSKSLIFHFRMQDFTEKICTFVIFLAKQCKSVVVF